MSAKVTRYQADPFAARAGAKRNVVPLLPSAWVENFVRVKDADLGAVAPMNFSERRYLRRAYDTPSQRLLLMTSRQTEKSTTLANKLLSLAGMHAIHSSLFVTPSAMQTKVFSSGRIDGIIEVSPLLEALTHKSLTMNLLQKEFINKSTIFLRYAFLSADRIRGLSVNNVYIDEIQDILQTLLPVIEETATHHKNTTYCYSGTPKTFDNTIEELWSKHSSQSEWAIPCERHGLPSSPHTWHWNVLGDRSLGKLGPICDRCGGPLNPEHPLATWVAMRDGTQFEGLRICRLMVPWFFKDPKKWKEILDAKERYPVAQWNNEVLALSYDSGAKPLTRADIVRSCDSRYELDNEEKVAELAETNTLYAGVDWGESTGNSAYTVIVIGGYVRGDAKFQIVFAKRLTGLLAEPDAQVQEVLRLLDKFRIKYSGVDYGMGFFANKALINVHGAAKIHPFQYAARSPAKLVYKPQLHRYLVYRSPMMSDVFTAIKAGKLSFPNYTEFADPFGADMLNIRAEYSEQLRMVQYIKISGKTDDSFHAILYCLLASTIDHPRPDIFVPIRETTAEAHKSYAEEHMHEIMNSMLGPYDDGAAM